MQAGKSSLSKKLFSFDNLQSKPTDGVFRANNLLWDRADAQWISKDGKMTTMTKHIVAGLELDSKRIKSSIPDPELHVDLFGPETDPLNGYKRNDYEKQLQRMYIQLMRPKRFRNYVGTGSVLSGWQYINTGIDELLNVGDDVYSSIPAPSKKTTETAMYGPNPSNKDGDDDWSDRVGYRIAIPRGSETSTFSFPLSELNKKFEKLIPESAKTVAAKILDDELGWRKNGVQCFYEIETRVHPLLGQPPAGNETYFDPEEYESIHTPQENWLDNPSLNIEFQGNMHLVNQSAALETIYSTVAGRVGCGVPVVSMGPHMIDGEWRLASIRVLPEKHLWDQLIETQTYIDNNESFAETSQLAANRQTAVTKLMLARIESFEYCICRLAQVGFLHLGLSGVNMFQGTVYKPGIGGEGSFPVQGGQFFGGAGATHVRDFRPRNVAIVRLPIDACSVIMRTILLLDLYSRDVNRDLPLLDNVGSITVVQISNLITTRADINNKQFDHFYTLMVQCWDALYGDAKDFVARESQTLSPPPLVTTRPPPPPPLRPNSAPSPISPPSTVVPPRPLKSELRTAVPPEPPVPFIPQEEEVNEQESSPSSNPYVGKTINTEKNDALFFELFKRSANRSNAKDSSQIDYEIRNRKIKKSNANSMISDRTNAMLDAMRQKNDDADNESNDEFEEEFEYTAPQTQRNTTGPKTSNQASNPSKSTSKSTPNQTPSSNNQLPDVNSMKQLMKSRRKSMAESESESDSDFGRAFSFDRWRHENILQPTDSPAGEVFTHQMERLKFWFQQNNKDNWSPPRDSLVLALRLTHRLYDLVRTIAYNHSRELTKRGVTDVDPQLQKENKDSIPPGAVRRFCGDPTATAQTALELAASCLKKYAIEPQ